MNDPRALPLTRFALLAAVVTVVLGLGLYACRTMDADAGPAPAARQHYLVIGGVKIPTDAPVISFLDEDGYNAYVEHCWFEPDRVTPTKPLRGTDQAVRWRERDLDGLSPTTAARVQAEGWDMEAVQERVDQFVLHYDVCGCSRSCFKVLHDVRGLSVHFMLDLDGTIYQTMDLSHKALHATIANDRSIGIEIAQMGAYPKRETLDQWYKPDETGRTRIHLSPWQGDGGLRVPDFIARPASDEPIQGPIHDARYWQYDFTPEQYESLVLLTRSLAAALPKIRIDAPRDARGEVLTGVLSPAQFSAFTGLLGHYHVQRNKIDPGPAFDWERLLRDVRGE